MCRYVSSLDVCVEITLLGHAVASSGVGRGCGGSGRRVGRACRVC